LRTSDFGTIFGSIVPRTMKKHEHISIAYYEPDPQDARLLDLLLRDLDAPIPVKPQRIHHPGEVLDHIDILLAGIDDALDPAARDLIADLAGRTGAYLIAVIALHQQEQIAAAIEAGARDVLFKSANFSENFRAKMAVAIPVCRREARIKSWIADALVAPWEYETATGVLSFPDLTGLHGFLQLREDALDVLRDRIRNEIQNCRESGQTTTEIQISLAPKKDLSRNPKYFFLKILTPEKKQNDGTIRGFVQDITELRLADEVYRETHQKYLDIFANASDGIYMSTITGYLKESNSAGLKIFGLQEEKDFNIHQLFKSDDADILVDIGYRKPIKNREVEIIRPDGSVRNCLLSVVYFSDESDLYTGILRDVTDRKMAEELQRTRQLEQESNQLKEQFIAAISHEMRTPMNAIIGLSNLLLETKLTDEQRDYLRSIQLSSEQLLGILNDILDLSSIKSGQLKFDNKNFDLYDLLHNLVRNLSIKAQEKGLEVKLHIDPELPRILIGDKLRLNQVLYNIAGNAIKFTDSGFVKIAANLLGRTGDSVLIQFAVQDTGIGIPKEKQEAIFDSFTRISYKDRIFEGTGLGLAISKKLITQQGGKIWVNSEVGKGSTFYFDLILDVGQMETGTDTPETDREMALKEPRHILIVEDNKMNQFVAQKLLTKRWPEVKLSIAANGRQALDLLSEDMDIVLMDLQMPVMDGYETTATIRALDNPKLRDLPILAMTADAQIQEADKAESYGLDGFIVKPFDPGILYEKILHQLNSPTGKVNQS